MNVSPGVYTKLLDFSEYLKLYSGTIGFICIYSEKGIDRELIQTNSNDFYLEFGNPNMLYGGKYFAQSMYVADNFLRHSDNLYVLRVTQLDATFSNLCLMYDKINGKVFPASIPSINNYNEIRVYFTENFPFSTVVNIIEYTVIPNVIGMNYIQSVSRMNNNKIKVGNISGSYQNNPIFSVTYQGRPAGEIVEINTLLDILISFGVFPKTSILKLTGKEYNSTNIEESIINRKLLQGNVTSIFSPLAAGLVYSKKFNGLSLNPGHILDWGDHIDLRISLGVGDDGNRAIPNVIDMTIDDVLIEIQDESCFILGIVRGENSLTVPVGSIISQDPDPGSLVPILSSVNTIISIGRNVRSTLNNLIDYPFTRSLLENEIINNNFILSNLYFSESPKVPGGILIQSKPAGIYSWGTSLDLTLSRGVTHTYNVVVPNIVGRFLNEETKNIVYDGDLLFSEDGNTVDYSDNYNANIILEQNPPAGTTVPIGSFVTFKLSLGKKPKTSVNTNLFGFSLQDSVEEIENKGFRINPSPYTYPGDSWSAQIINSRKLFSMYEQPGFLTSVGGCMFNYPQIGSSDWGTTVGMAISKGPNNRDLHRTPLSQLTDWTAINTIEDLQRIGNHVDYPLDGKYYLNRNIDASATSGWNVGKGFDPIGSVDVYQQSDFVSNPEDYFEFDYRANVSSPEHISKMFTGKFDGRHYTISNLYINRPNENYIGLFSAVYGSECEIKNITLENVDITGLCGVGALIGMSKMIESSERVDQIQYCFSSGVVRGHSFVGGLLGGNRSGGIFFCHSSCEVIGSHDLIWPGVRGKGDLLWEVDNYDIDKDPIRSSNPGSIDPNYWWRDGARPFYVGGLVGRTSWIAAECSASGNVYGEIAVGGLWGAQSRTHGIYNCYAEGDVYGSDLVGGLIGVQWSAGFRFENCYSYGKVTATGVGAQIYYMWDDPNSPYRGVGGLVGCCQSNYLPGVANINPTKVGGVFDCYWNEDADHSWKNIHEITWHSTMPYSGPINPSSDPNMYLRWLGGTSKSQDDIDNCVGFDTWNRAFWGLFFDGEKPFLRRFKSIVPNLVGDTFGSSYYLGENYAYSVAAYGDYKPIGSFAELQSIGTSPDFPRNGKYILIRDIECIIDETQNYFTPICNTVGTAFTGILDGNGFSINDLKINQVSSFTYGGLIGVNSGCITNLKIRRAEVSFSNTTGGTHHGILCGLNLKDVGVSPSAIIRMCSVEGALTGRDTIGSLVGENRGGSIDRCSGTGTVTCICSSGTPVVAGLVGLNNGAGTGLNIGLISNCYFNGEICVNLPTARAAGLTYGKTTGNSFISTSYVVPDWTGSVSGSPVVTSQAAGFIFYTYWDTDVSGTLSHTYGTPKTTSQLQNINTFTSDPVTFDIYNIWFQEYIPNRPIDYLKLIEYYPKSIEGNGLYVDSVLFEYNDSPAGTILTQSIDEFNIVSRWSPLSFTVSAGPEIKTTVPLTRYGGIAYPFNDDTSVNYITALHDAFLYPDENNISFIFSEQGPDDIDTPTGRIYNVVDPVEEVYPGTDVSAVISLGAELPIIYEEVTPDVVGESLSEAYTDIKHSGYNIGDILLSYSDVIPVLEVISQDPVGETSHPLGSSIDLVLSRGPQVETTVVPNLETTILSGDTFTTLYDSKLLISNQIQWVESGEVPGTILSGSQNPVPGSVVAIGTKVLFNVSKGEPDDQGVLPDITGMPLSTSVNTLSQTSFVLADAIFQQNASPVGYVFLQSPESGNQTKGSEVTLYVSTGEYIGTSLMPDLIGSLHNETTVELLNDLCIILSENTSWVYDDSSIGTILEQSIEPETEVTWGSQVTLVISKGPDTGFSPYDNYDLLAMFLGRGRGKYYNNFKINIRPHSKSYLYNQGLYFVDVYKKVDEYYDTEQNFVEGYEGDTDTRDYQKKEEYEVSQTFEISFDPDVVNISGDSMFIEDVFDLYGRDLKVITHRDRLRRLALQEEETETKIDWCEKFIEYSLDENGNYELDPTDKSGGTRLASYISYPLNLGIDGSLDYYTDKDEWYQHMKSQFALAYSGKLLKVQRKDLMNNPDEDTYIKNDIKNNPELLYVDEVLDKEGYPFNLVFDAGFPFDIKVTIADLCKILRKDCVAILDNFDNSSSEKALKNRKSRTMFNSYYCSLYDGYSLIYDEYTKRNIWITPVYHVAAMIPYVDKSYPGWASASGINRCSLDNLIQIRYNLSKAEKETFYLNQINSIIKDSGSFLLWGDQTTYRRGGPLGSLHNVRTVLYISKAIESFCNYYIFSENTDSVWSSISDEISIALSTLKENNTLYTYSVEVGSTESERKQKKIHVNVMLGLTELVEQIFLTFFII